MPSNINGKVALITGASSGIGEAIAEALAKDGAKVALLARRLEKLEQVRNKITNNGGSCYAVQADVTNKQQVEDAVKKIELEFGTVEILINNAGVFNPSPVKNLKLDSWLQVVDVNVKGVLYCIGATLGPMVEKGGGHIVNLSSIGGKRAQTQVVQASPYYGSKFFIQGFSSGLRQELAPKGIKVSTVCPGGVLTDLLQTITDPDAKTMVDHLVGIGPQALIERDMILKPEDIAETVAYIVNQPSRVSINDVVVEPRAMSFV